jgi:hypothetical protein
VREEAPVRRSEDIHLQPLALESPELEESVVHTAETNATRYRFPQPAGWDSRRSGRADDTTSYQPGAITRSMLVTGAAGQVGAVRFKIVERLRGKGIPVSAMVRRDDDRSQALATRGADIVKGDLTDVSDVSRVMEGCRRLYCGMSGSSSYLEAPMHTAAVAKHDGVELFLHMPQMTVSEMSLSKTPARPQPKRRRQVLRGYQGDGRSGRLLRQHA